VSVSEVASAKKASGASASAELASLRARLEEAEQTLEAIRSGNVDALVVSGPDGERIFTLQGADHRYRRIVEGMTEGAAIVNAEGTVLYANSFFARMVGTPLERVLGSKLRAHVPPSSARTFDRLIAEARSGTATAEAEVLAGEKGILPVHVSAVDDGDLEAGGICLILTDLSESLRESEARFRTLATTTSQMVFTTGPDGVIRADSPSWRAFTGQSLEEYTGGGARDAIHPDDREMSVDVAARKVRDKLPFEVEYRLRRHDGAYVTMAMRSAPVLNEDGTVREWVGANTDISERKAHEQRRDFMANASTALASSLDYRATLQRVAELAVPALASLCTVDILEDDRSTWQQLAVAHEGTPTVRLAEALAIARRRDSALTRASADGLRAGRSELYSVVTEEVLGAIAADETHLEALRQLGMTSAMVVPIRARGITLGAITFAYCDDSSRYGAGELAFAEDLAARAGTAIDNARLYASEHAAREAADVSNRAKDEFLATVSHELRTPLNAMLGWSRMLSGGQLPEAKKGRALEAIERNAVAQAQLIEDLLDVSRIISGKLRLDVETVDLRKVIHASVDTVSPAIEAKGLRLVMALDPEPANVNGDPNRLQQIIWNLLSNAVKFTPRGGRVEVVLARDAGHFALSIKDSGRGIPASFVPHVFERFRQADGGITRVTGGLGIGLAISRHLVELHGGTIDVASEGEDRGATFVVKLPRPASRATPVEARRSSQLQSSDATFDCPPELAGLKVLVVDDEPDARELLVVILERCGSKVVTASSAAEALAQIDREAPNVMLSDIGMPGEDGYALIAAVRKRGVDDGGSTPAAALTSYARAEDRRRALQAGYQMHLPKPAEPAELVAVVANLARMIVVPR
jgi:PAS domain S-box-containing protein